MQRYYNPKRVGGLTFSEGDIIYLSIKNITIKQLSYKLNFKYIRPYKIIKKILKNNYELDLLLKVRLYLIFYILLLKLAEGTI